MTRTPGERLGQFVSLLDDTGQNMVPTVATLAALQAVSTTGLVDGESKRDMDGRTSAGDGGEGRFVWRSGDQSANVAADEVGSGLGNGGIWIAPSSDLTGASGAWERMAEVANAEAYGTDSAGVVQAFASPHTVKFVGTYTVSAGVIVSKRVVCVGAKLVYDTNLTTAFEARENSVIAGDLEIDVSAITCTSAFLISGENQYDHDTAPKGGIIKVTGQNHTATTYGFDMDATRPAGDNRSFIQYCIFSAIIIENCNYGLRMTATETGGITDSWCNANEIGRLTLIGCKNSIEMNGDNAELSSNIVHDFVVQYGFVMGSGPVRAVNLTGNCWYNQIDGFVYDWDLTNSPAPIIALDADTLDNRVASSPATWEIEDLGLRNRYESMLYPTESTLWLGLHGRNFLGNQDNILSHFAIQTGTLAQTISSSGTASVSVAAGAVTDIQTENDTYLELSFTAGTGEARYEAEFRSTTDVMNAISVVGAYFEKGYEPQSVAVEIDTGAGYVLRADVDGVTGNEFFGRLDAVGGTDITDGALGIKISFKGSDTRTVRVRQVFANGSMPSTFPSRGGDRMGGDLHWRAGTGPVLVDTATGVEYRLQVTSGALALVANPTKVLTYF